MTQALLAAIYAMTLDDPVEASRYFIIEWQAAFEACALPTTMAVFAFALQGFGQDALTREPTARGLSEVPLATERTPRRRIPANADREFAHSGTRAAHDNGFAL